MIVNSNSLPADASEDEVLPHRDVFGEGERGVLRAGSTLVVDLKVKLRGSTR